MPSKTTSFIKQYLTQEYILLALIFIVFLITRIYNLDKRIIFGWDQEQFTTQIRDIVLNLNFTLLGPRVNNDLGFFLAPYLTYFLVPWYIVTNLHPIALLYWTAFINILFFIVSFLTIKKMFSFHHALWFLTLWTLHSVAHSYDTTPWWPQLIPLGVMLTLLILSHLKDKPDKVYVWVLLGLSQGIFINMHFQFIFIFIFSTLFIILNFKNEKKIIKYIFLYLGSFLFTFTPLFIFDLRNDFLNTKLFFNFFINGTDSVQRNLISWLPVFGNFIQPFTFIKDSLTALSFFVIITQIINYLIQKSKKDQKNLYKALFIIWILVAVFFSIYGRRPSEYYFIFSLPFILIAIIDFLFKVNQKIFFYVLFIFFFLFNITSLIHNMNENLGGLYYKEEVVKYIKKEFYNQSFNITYNGVSVDHGFKYLLEYHGVKQSGKQNDPLIEISIPAREHSTLFGLYGVKAFF